jgi:hypothetical protein
MFLSINMISYGRNIIIMDIELFIVRMPQAFKCLIILRQDSSNFLRTILIDPFHVHFKYIASAFLVAAKES